MSAIATCNTKPPIVKPDIGLQAKLNHQLHEVLMEDQNNPLFASRALVYSQMAFYEGLIWNDSIQNKSIIAQCKLFGSYDSVSFFQTAYPELTATVAFCNTANTVCFSGFRMMDYLENQLDTKWKHIPKKEKALAIDCGNYIARFIAKRIKQDGYAKIRTMPRYTVRNQEGYWQVTPPDYTPGLEPHWNIMQSMLTDSTDQSDAQLDLIFNKNKNSDFYNEAFEVYSASNVLDSSKFYTAWYWDDNPNISHNNGHLSIVTHKYSPAAHWISIVSQSCLQQNKTQLETARIHALCSIALYDAFINCWYYKYKYELVRPITFIQKYIDVNWKPMLQTPPFPEYPSGHSMISGAVVEVLNNLIGNNISFTDTTQVKFRMNSRTYPNFDKAGSEASISRLYGGIHYRYTVDKSYQLGKNIGKAMLAKIK